jgi:hypothetical protein
VKLQSSLEAYGDSRYDPSDGHEGSSQLMCIRSDVYPVGLSALNGIVERAGMKMSGWDKLREYDPESLSNVLNRFMEATPGYLTVLVEDEKVRAVNGARYAPCPASTVMRLVNEWVQAEYPKATFLEGYSSHDYARWYLDLKAYTDIILASCPDLKTREFVPVLTIVLSNTGTSSVALYPSLRLKNLIFPIGEGICAPHIAAGKFGERVAKMEETVKQNLSAVFSKLEAVSKSVEELKEVQVNNAYNALLRGMKSLGLPRVYAMEAAYQFEVFYGKDVTTTTSAFDIYMELLDVLEYVARDFPDNAHKQFSVAKCIERAAVGIDWKRLGEIPGNFSW